jgi:hypothetical protein
MSEMGSTLGGRHRTPAFENLKRSLGFAIFSLLRLKCFCRRVVPPILRQLLLIEFDPLATMLHPINLAHFFRNETEFQFCATDEFVACRQTGTPLFIDIRSCFVPIKWIIPDLNEGFLHSSIAHLFTPVINM